MVHRLSALELAQEIRTGNLTAREVTDHYLARIEAMNSGVGAYLTVTADLAEQQADRADAALRAGIAHSPFHGVPVPIKDLNLVAGVPTTFGSAALSVTPMAGDAIAERLAEAGTIMIGKTNTPEFGLPCYTEPDVGPPARSPWDVRKSAGGSSGGAGAAVAAGLAPIAQGSDGGGSIRIPASVCGLVGIKPSRGRISNAPLGESVGELATNGPLARTVADAGALLDILAGHTTGDLFHAPEPPHAFMDAAARSPGRLRIGRTRTPFIADSTVDPEVIAAYEGTSALLEELGHTIIDVDLNIHANLVDQFENVWATLAASIPLDPSREDLLRPLTRWLRERGHELSAVDLSRAVSAMRQTTRSLLERWRDFDVLLTPTLAALPADVGALRNDADPAADFAAQKAYTPFTALANMTGQPAMSLPIMWTTNQLPIGMHFIGRPFDEALLISLGGQLEHAAPWRYRYVDLWEGHASSTR
jgi:amidase